MKRYIQYIIIALLASFTAVSCLEELDPETPVFENEVLTLVPRVQSFANQYVTKAGEGDAEIKSLAVLIFNNGGSLVHKQEFTDFENASVNINKTMLNLNNPTEEQKLTEATVVMIANIPLANIKNSDEESLADVTSLTLEGLNAYTYTLKDAQAIITEKPTTGFPMVGNATVNLSHTYTEAIGVELNILYAKINFSISVTSGSENQGDGVSFTLEKYTVNNVAKEITLMKPEAETATSSYYSGFTNEPKNTTDLSSNKDPLKFTFYMLESRYEHNLSSTQISSIYPWGTSAGYESYQQMYKPQLVTAAGSPNNETNGLATNVRLSGKYTDYRGTNWNVDYTVYLGKDNAQNFQVDRNSEYTNIITIKGIRNSSNAATGNGEVWIDHRVNVSYAGDSADDCVTITRQTLIDSHIEVRPLRVKWGKDSKGNDLYTLARVYLPYYQDNGTTWTQRDESSSQKKNWIGIELGDKTGSLYCSGDDNPSKGKRKYFTETLVSELNDIKENTDIVTGEGDKFIALSNNQCAWIYIDEYWHDESTATNPAANDREAKVVVDFCTIENNAIKVKNREEYILSQQPLIKIDGGKYYLENYEEYLYSYDSQDRYSIETSPTDYTGQGLKWGYTEEGTERVSKSQFVTKTVIAGWAPTNNEAYDLLHQKDKAELGDEWKVVDKDGNSIDLSSNNGYNFTYNVSANNGVYISRMDKMPESAYQYCLSKNKFKEGTEGEDNQMLIRWYVPDVYELSDIFQDESSQLFEDSYYWSSQVPYAKVTNNLIGTIASEVESQARAVSKDKGIENRERIEKHRIRCLYNRNGKTANMENRTPEGIGGLIKIPMTVANNGFFDYEDWLESLGEEPEPYPDPEPSLKYPMGSTLPENNEDREDADNDFGGDVDENDRHYYKRNPTSSSSWDKITVGDVTYYSTIHESKWPGLTEFEVKNVSLAGYSAICSLTDETKKIQKKITIRSGEKIEAMPNTVSAVPLDHNEEKSEGESEGLLFISFAQGSNGTTAPTYEYYNEAPGATCTTWTKEWVKPIYTPDPNNGVEETFTGDEYTLESTAEAARLLKNESLKRNGYEISYSKTEKKQYTGAWGIKYYRYYYLIKASKNKYYYTAAGYWGKEQEVSGNVPVKKSDTDALTFYAGNTFTLTAKEGYCIRSVKVNYYTSTLSENTKYLRFVTSLPGTNEEPSQMTYLDGANGWSKWVSEGQDSLITLKLVICNKNTDSWWIGNWGNPQMTHSDPGRNEYGYNLVVNSLEIRVEKIED